MRAACLSALLFTVGAAPTVSAQNPIVYPADGQSVVAIFTP